MSVFKEVRNVQVSRKRCIVASIYLMLGGLIATSIVLGDTPQCITPGSKVVVCTNQATTVYFSAVPCATAPSAAAECTAADSYMQWADGTIGNSTTLPAGPYSSGGYKYINSPGCKMVYDFNPTQDGASCPSITQPVGPATRATVEVVEDGLTASGYPGNPLPNSLMCNNAQASASKQNYTVKVLPAGTMGVVLPTSDSPVQDVSHTPWVAMDGDTVTVTAGSETGNLILCVHNLDDDYCPSGTATGKVFSLGFKPASPAMTHGPITSWTPAGTTPGSTTGENSVCTVSDPNTFGSGVNVYLVNNAGPASLAKVSQAVTCTFQMVTVPPNSCSNSVTCPTTFSASHGGSLHAEGVVNVASSTVTANAVISVTGLSAGTGGAGTAATATATAPIAFVLSSDISFNGTTTWSNASALYTPGTNVAVTDTIDVTGSRTGNTPLVLDVSGTVSETGFSVSLGSFVIH